MSIISLVKKIGYKDRASYYAHINKPDLSIEILSSYAKALNYDLRQDLGDIHSITMEDPTSIYYNVPESLEEAIDLLAKWKDKYSLLLEKYIRLMEDKEGNI